MRIDQIIDAVAARLRPGLAPGTVADVMPGSPAQLPCAVLALADVRTQLDGVGRIPRGTRTGALRLAAAIDLDDPVLDLGGGESLRLLSPDRLTLTLPHGPIVRADGTGDPTLGGLDVSASDGQPFLVVAGPPAARQVRADPVAGTLVFGEPLAGAGRLNVTYHVGAWDTVTTRAQGLLTVQVWAAAAPAVSVAARVVAGLLAEPAPGLRTTPAFWQSAVPSSLGDDRVVCQTLGFRLDAELEEPALTTSGGPLIRVAVRGGLLNPSRPSPDPVEPFDVTRSTE